MLVVGEDQWLEAVTDSSYRFEVSRWAFGVTHLRGGFCCHDRVVDWHWLLLVIDGRCECEAAGEQTLLEPGSVIWLPPSAAHSMTWSDPLQCSELYFRLLRMGASDVATDSASTHAPAAVDDGPGADWTEESRIVQSRASNTKRTPVCKGDGLGPPPRPGLDESHRMQNAGTHVVPVDQPQIWHDMPWVQSSLEQLADEVEFAEPRYHVRLRNLMAALAVMLWRQARRGVEPVAGLTANQQAALRRYVRQHGAETIAPADLAGHLGLSANYFSRLFRHSFGQTPRVWLSAKRMHIAADWLQRSDLSVQQIASHMGYSEVPQFSRQFKRVMGVGPRAYRQSQRRA